MQIAGIQKTTLLDYPGKVATIIFTPGCNFRCGFCHNAEQVLPDLITKNASNNISQEAFFNFLEMRKSILDAVVICGGEPTLQPDLKKFAQKIKELGLLVKVDTNGQNVQIIKEMIDEKLVDFVAMDIKSTPKKYSEVTSTLLDQKYFQSHQQLIEVLKNAPIQHEFRTTVIKGQHTLQDIEDIAKMISGAQTYAIQNFKPGKTLDLKFTGISFGEKELLEMQQIAKKHLPQVLIRN